MPGYVELYRKGELEVDRYVTYTMKLEKINQAFELMKEGKGIYWVEYL